ncbi:hypothetical protein SCP_1202250 [Sparassis crispa]|uniref:Uncharacterized protein n=1 Tax=Sparassis crispa TaxID=139825 RepID=A0A401H0T7_9APHY|nr:hypothetical protein SCP_1202250 [Sparassis crispa]GBE87999.1 hypothetical protein SCP_1202250 [Sparassis crispa]
MRMERPDFAHVVHSSRKTRDNSRWSDLSLGHHCRQKTIITIQADYVRRTLFLPQGHMPMVRSKLTLSIKGEDTRVTNGSPAPCEMDLPVVMLNIVSDK